MLFHSYTPIVIFILVMTMSVFHMSKNRQLFQFLEGKPLICFDNKDYAEFDAKIVYSVQKHEYQPVF